MKEMKKNIFINMPKIKKQQMFFSFLLASFWILFLWGFFERGVFALGLNIFIFLSGFTGFFLWILHKKENSLKNNIFWIIPISLVVLSFLIYENPALKIISIFVVFPLFFALFYNFSFLKNNKEKYWDSIFLSALLNRAFSFLVKLKEAANLFLEYIFPAKKGKSLVLKKVIFGTFLFLLVALGVVVPLLSSADAVFGEKIIFIYEWLKDIVSPVLLYKFLFLSALSLLILSALLSWSREFLLKEDIKKEEKDLDSIISGIVIGGISLIYLLFLWVQAGRLFVGTLPFEFREVESLVKSGFWQLFFLTLLNILIYIFAHKKTNKFVQAILFTFTITSLLLLFSAGQRMLLYVLNYGFSYEKLFALYTVLFCAILFFWLIFGFFSENKKNIMKFSIILFLWMYSFLTILPVEQFIFRTNVHLKNNTENSNIKLAELRMLSTDVLSLAKKYRREGTLNEKIVLPSNLPHLAGTTPDIVINQDQYWDDWIKIKENNISKKPWYEKNLSDILNSSK